MDLIDRGPSARLLWGLGGLEPKKKGWANLARALAARFEYFCGGGGGGGGTGDREPERSDMVYSQVSIMAHDHRIGGRKMRRVGDRRDASGEGKIPEAPIHALPSKI